MNDKEALALYGKRIAPAVGLPSTEKKKIAEEVKECLAAKDLDEAVAILLIHGWGRPVECAMKLRGPIPCPACGGTGIV